VTEPTRSGAEVAIFITRNAGAEALIVHRSPVQGSYWHVIAGGVEPGETAREAAVRELYEETRLVAVLEEGPQVVEYQYALTEEPAPRRGLYDDSVEAITVTCFRAAAPDGWEPILDWEHDDHRWCPPTEAAASLRWPETAAALLAML
jgi:8-oxo-dGTP pyrophosphatase MutT (NUDIX family)